ncbi:hypothetical protein A2U01_0117654, partial [Trifolium medium]|nr:hypothetical protein [Trifolium medium]
ALVSGTLFLLDGIPLHHTRLGCARVR